MATKGLLSAICEPSVVAQLRDFDDAVRELNEVMPGEVKDATIRRLLSVLERHGMHEVAAIDLKHRHDEIPHGQAYVERPNVALKFSTMRAEVPDDKCVPMSFILAPNGEWQPHEYVVAGCTKADERFAAVRNNESFLRELADELRDTGLSHLLGLHIIHREHLQGAKRGIVETPGEQEGTLLIRPYTEDVAAELAQKSTNKVVQVMWKKPNPWQIDWCGVCSHSCTSHCISHSKKAKL
eukprot:TRINITY_DN381_c0_g1_i1.p2 TRINITY_DN381_c0_g1~~TRINITY_DN381_c0_g1_i1.p2  ORF type:complete len:265 (+),score=79.00 TRINITY_DN381_c0_g1_i1:81-797(+)